MTQSTLAKNVLQWELLHHAKAQADGPIVCAARKQRKMNAGPQLDYYYFLCNQSGIPAHGDSTCIKDGCILWVISNLVKLLMK